ncbi:unnamed protein product [Didymodactylos carnosus]|uniref:Uncharacterized protein n=1 Tax=Didymodactylos carnosus TaxID=1234261 RepID=A0A815IG65_9BILA|nr:unnamed protein product [Didymodactylos carnosus]CAF1365552.1 unnamed protein product [Didymodactylos carnosus]CAF3543733.1 unnamed protein product [Didymodactylos carnosus]CAF4247544.1 unnamed protein product [Didymodactylos carnosus]
MSNSEFHDKRKLFENSKTLIRWARPSGEDVKIGDIPKPRRSSTLPEETPPPIPPHNHHLNSKNDNITQQNPSAKKIPVHGEKPSKSERHDSVGQIDTTLSATLPNECLFHKLKEIENNYVRIQPDRIIIPRQKPSKPPISEDEINILHTYLNQISTT